MNPFRLLVWLAALASFALPAKAHRLDECLQATRLDISANRVELEIDLTPGVRVADAFFALLDSNRDGILSDAERDAYAKHFLAALVLSVDGCRRALKLVAVRYPDFAEMKAGTGVIHLQASAEFAPLEPGAHQLYYQNQNQTNLSVYLVNAYLPKSPVIQITRQKRDLLQTEICIDFTFSTNLSTVPRLIVQPEPAARAEGPVPIR